MIGEFFGPARLVEKQSGREFASADPTAGAQDATFQERSVCAEIPINACRRLQYFQRPTPPHVSSITPGAPHCGDEYVARSSRPLEIAGANAASPRRFDNVTAPILLQTRIYATLGDKAASAVGARDFSSAGGAPLPIRLSGATKASARTPRT